MKQYNIVLMQPEVKECKEECTSLLQQMDGDRRFRIGGLIFFFDNTNNTLDISGPGSEKFRSIIRWFKNDHLTSQQVVNKLKTYVLFS